MDELQSLLQDSLNIDMLTGIFSNPRERGNVKKVKIRPVLRGEELLIQFESYTEKQVFHENLKESDACGRCVELLENFRQLQLETKKEKITVLISKKGKVTIKKKGQQGCVKQVDLSHNRKKHYILEEGIYVPFLEDLGVMTSEGKIVRTRYDKFRQINRFLEFVEDILPALDRGRELTILDFGCGKSYLTFAMYYYLHELKGYDIRIIGLDLKEEVIAKCAGLAQEYGYEKLTFLTGDIAEYTGVEHVDMVVTLHACDTATDYALDKAIGWNAKVILSVPCCQHELNAQFESNGSGASEVLEPILGYGLLRERFAALVTDGLRANYLEQAGYETQVLEFIDMEHTPKNILLRAVKRSGENTKSREKARMQIAACEEFLKVQPTLGRLMEE